VTKAKLCGRSFAFVVCDDQVDDADFTEICVFFNG
jgi:hypothetical protein